MKHKNLKLLSYYSVFKSGYLQREFQGKIQGKKFKVTHPISRVGTHPIFYVEEVKGIILVGN